MVTPLRIDPRREDPEGPRLHAEEHAGDDIPRSEADPRDHAADGRHRADAFGENAQHPNIPPYFGFDIAKDLELVQGVNGSVVGYYVLDGQGVIYPLGNAPDVGQVVDLQHCL